MKFVLTSALVVALSLPATAGADPSPPAAEPAESPIHFLSTATLTTDGGTTVRLKPGYYLSEPLWDKLDIELHRLQDTETRLKAENSELRKNTGGMWGNVLGFMSGLGAGYAAIRWGDDLWDKIR